MKAQGSIFRRWNPASGRVRERANASHPSGGRVPPVRSAFTLIEVLLALILLAALLTAINQFVFSITEAWTKNQDQFVFVQHTRAVTRHVEELLQVAVNSGRASNAGSAASGAPAPAEMRTPEGTTADVLAFDLPMGDRLFTWPSTPLPEVQCGLAWRKEDGLVLYWKSRLEADFATANPRMVVLSSFVTSLTYDYYDDTAKTWSTEEELQKDAGGALTAPRRIRLHFQRKGRDYEEIIEVPQAAEGLPAY